MYLKLIVFLQLYGAITKSAQLNLTPKLFMVGQTSDKNAIKYYVLIDS